MKLSRLLLILTIFALFAGVTPTVHAQNQPPDLALEFVSLSGETAVIYRNDGATISNRPYVVSFQWVDANGSPLAPVQNLTRSALPTRGRETLGWNNTNVEGTIITYEQRCYSTGGWFRRRTQCDTVQVPRTVTKTLAEYRATRPNPAAMLAVKLDEGNRIAESNEGNNFARVGNTPFQGPPPAPIAELAITQAVFAGQNLFVAFQNQSSANISNQPFYVGLQWQDQTGQAVGDKRFIGFKNMPPGKVEVIDSRTGITVLQQTGPGVNEVNVAGTLSEYLATRPANVARLQITVDARDQILENTKANNVATIGVPPLLLPDLAITKQVQIFNPQQLVFSYANLGQTPSTISFWFEWVDAKGARVGNHLYWQDRGSLPPSASAVFVSSGAQVISSSGTLLLDKVLQSPPPEATSLKITIDGPNAVRETDETNNILILPKPIRPFPDFVFGSVAPVGNTLRVEIQNKGNVPAAPADLMLVWLSSTGATVASAILPYATQTIAPNISQALILALTGQRPLERLLAGPPANATRFQLIIDSTRRITEINEDNNTIALERSILPAALPDLVISSQPRILNAQQLVFGFANTSKVALPQTAPLSFWFEWVDANGARVSDMYWHDRSPASAPPVVTTIFNSAGVYVYSSRGPAPLNSLLTSPPALATHLKVTIDGPNRFRESDESNNTMLLPKPIVPLADLTFGAIAVREGALRIEVKNQGTISSAPTDVWLQWWNAGEPMGGNVAVQISNSIAPKGLYAFLLVNSKTPEGWLISHPPQGATQLRLTVDGSNRVTESNEGNNGASVDRATIPALAPELTLMLTTQVMRTQAAAHSVSPFATAGFVLALFGLFGGSLLMIAHRGNSKSYGTMRKVTRVSLATTIGTGAAKIILSFMILSVFGPLELLSAQTDEALVGDQVRANMVIKNVGSAPATEVKVYLPCPEGTAWVSTTANGAGQSRNAGEGISMADLTAGSAHGLSVICKMEAGAGTKGSVRFSGSAQIKEVASKFNSNSVDITVKPRATGPKPDLEVGGTGLLPKEDIVKEANQPFEPDFTAIIQNSGPVSAPATRARLRVDTGADGSWDAIAPAFVDVGALTPDETALVKWTVSWRAPLGRYAFEMCADADKIVDESDEANNCTVEHFSLQAGEEPIFEEEVVE